MTLILFSGSNINNFFRRSMASGLANEKSLLKSFPTFLFLGRCLINFLLSSGICFMLSTSGVPRYSQMSSI